MNLPVGTRYKYIVTYSFWYVTQVQLQVLQHNTRLTDDELTSSVRSEVKEQLLDLQIRLCQSNSCTPANQQSIYLNYSG